MTNLITALLTRLSLPYHMFRKLEIKIAQGSEMNNNHKVKSTTDKSKYFKISHACRLLFSIHKVLNNPQRVVRVCITHQVITSFLLNN